MAHLVKEKIKDILHPPSRTGGTTTNVPEAFFPGAKPVAPHETHSRHPYTSALGQQQPETGNREDPAGMLGTPPTSTPAPGVQSPSSNSPYDEPIGKQGQPEGSSPVEPVDEMHEPPARFTPEDTQNVGTGLDFGSDGATTAPPSGPETDKEIAPSLDESAAPTDNKDAASEPAATDEIMEPEAGDGDVDVDPISEDGSSLDTSATSTTDRSVPIEGEEDQAPASTTTDSPISGKSGEEDNFPISGKSTEEDNFPISGKSGEEENFKADIEMPDSNTSESALRS